MEIPLNSPVMSACAKARRRRPLLVLTSVALVLEILAWTALAPFRGVEVIVENHSASPVQKIAVTFTGGERLLGSIAPGGASHCKVNPRGESHLAIRYEDASSQAHEQPIDVYFETNYGGKIHIFIADAGRVTWRNDVRASWQNAIKV